jgi:hypothetical protein
MGAVRHDNQVLLLIAHGGALQLTASTLVVPAKRVSLDPQGRAVIGGLSEGDFQSLSLYARAPNQPLAASENIGLSRM